MKHEILDKAMRFYTTEESLFNINKSLSQVINNTYKRNNIIIRKEAVQTAILYSEAGSSVVKNEEHLKKYFTEDEIESIATLCEESDMLMKDIEVDPIVTVMNIIRKERTNYIKNAFVTTSRIVFEDVYENLKNRYLNADSNSYSFKEFKGREYINNILEDVEQFREVYYKSFI